MEQEEPLEQQVPWLQPKFPPYLADCSRGWVLWGQLGLHMSAERFVDLGSHQSASKSGQSCSRLFDRRHRGVATGHILHMRHSVIDRRRARHIAVDRKLVEHSVVGRKRAVCRKHRRQADRTQAGRRRASRRQAGHSEAEHRRAGRSAAERRQAGRSEERGRERAERKRVGRRQATHRREMAQRRQVVVAHERV